MVSLLFFRRSLLKKKVDNLIRKKEMNIDEAQSLRQQGWHEEVYLPAISFPLWGEGMISMFLNF